MDNDSKLRQANKIAREVRSDRGHPAKNDSGFDREDGSRINHFLKDQDVHEPPVIYQVSDNPHAAGSEGLSIQLERHLNRGEVQGDLDAVNRDSWPETPVLEAEFMGQGTAFRPPTAAGVSTPSRPPHKPVHKPSGARS